VFEVYRTVFPAFMYMRWNPKSNISPHLVFNFSDSKSAVRIVLCPFIILISLVYKSFSVSEKPSLGVSLYPEFLSSVTLCRTCSLHSHQTLEMYTTFLKARSRNIMVAVGTCRRASRCLIIRMRRNKIPTCPSQVSDADGILCIGFGFKIPPKSNQHHLKNF
jgi:hypothetical protein